ncbi:MAG TPA: pilin, partial [Steroidobacteraceae bacterium]|nr:pilin [Steroidobacteraceae bacterium]
SAVSIVSGAIEVQYNTTASNSAIRSSVLFLTPYADANNDITWVCGYAAAPSTAGASIASGATAGTSTLAPQYLPSACNA